MQCWFLWRRKIWKNLISSKVSWGKAQKTMLYWKMKQPPPTPCIYFGMDKGLDKLFKRNKKLILVNEENMKEEMVVDTAK